MYRTIRSVSKVLPEKGKIIEHERDPLEEAQRGIGGHGKEYLIQHEIATRKSIMGFRRGV